VLGRRRREREDSCPVTGRLGMVRESRQVRGADRRRLQRAERTPVQGIGTVRRQGLLDGDTSELVPERNASCGDLKHAGA